MIRTATEWLRPRVLGPVALAVALAAPAAAQVAGGADGLDPPTQSAGAERAGRLYVKAGLGAAFLGDLDQDIVYEAGAPGPDLPTGLSVGSKTGFAGGIAFGFAYPAGTRTELEYRYVRADIDRVRLTGGVSGDIDFPADRLGAHYLFSNILYDFRRDARFRPFIGAGVGGAFVDGGFSRRDAVVAWQAKAGFDFGLGARTALGVEAAYARTLQTVFSPEGDDDDPAPGARIDGGQLSSVSVMATLRREF